MSEAPVILITGASSGIGEATARLFAQHNYRVVLAARRAEHLSTLAEDIIAEGGQALAIPTDVTQIDQIHHLVKTTLDDFGQIDVLFNNAGVPSLGWLEDLEVNRSIDTPLQNNLVGLIHVTRAVLPHMIRRGRGQIINMSSVAGLVGTPTYSVYAASKFGVRGFTEALRREVGVCGVHVSGIYPGGVDTDFVPDPAGLRKTGITTPKIMRLSAEEVAASVYRMVQRKPRQVIIPWPLRVVVWVNTRFPGLVDWVIDNRFTRLERGL
jgi:short-subunit dehydrogenase